MCFRIKNLYSDKLNVLKVIQGGKHMAIVYKCRHCKHVMATLHHPEQFTLKQLGLEELSNEDKQEMIQHKRNGDLHIQIICESCEEMLKQNPHYHELDSFIQ